MESQEPWPPLLEEVFEGERRKQKSHVQVAEAKKNVKETVLTMSDLLDRAAERGRSIEVIEFEVEDLVDMSEDFHYASLPGWIQWIYSWRPPDWWFCGCCACCRRKLRKKVNVN